MAKCKLTKSLDNKICEYAVAGARDVYLANWYGPAEGDEAKDNAIVYKRDTDGYITGILLPEGEFFFHVDSSEDSISFSDELLEGGNGGKYRQHTVNATINQYDLDILNEGDALSLGRFIAIIVDSANRIFVLGRTGGLRATANGFDYNTGAAPGDDTGWTLALQGNSTELAQLVKDTGVITPLYTETVTP